VGVGVACKHLALFVRPSGKSATPEGKLIAACVFAACPQRGRVARST
jgi:hypothetical protein